MTQTHTERISIQGDLDGYSSLKAHKCTLVPSRFFNAGEARALLSEVVPVADSDPVDFVPVPEYDAVLVYSAPVMPALYNVLQALPSRSEYNRIIASYGEGYLHLGIAQGGSLLLANVFKAQDFTTAEYFLFLSLKTLQLNPEVSTICWMTPLSPDEEMSLYRYFKAVEQV